MQDYFYTLSDKMFNLLSNNEKLLISFEGENSDFIRFNHNKIRQAGSVALRTINLDLIVDKRHANANVDITGNTQQDISLLTYTLKNLREQCVFLPEDPYLLYANEINNLETHQNTSLIDIHDAVEQIHSAANQMDMVGILANGIQYTGFSNSMGQRNWHSNTNFNFDWSCYHEKDKAVKSAYAGFNWQAETLSHKMQTTEQQLALIARPPITIKPGKYRAYIAPAALNEIIGMMSWGGFSLKSLRTKETPLIQMLEQDRMLSPGLCIQENNARGLAPIFTSSGFIKPDQVQLIENGMLIDPLVDPRSAVEYSSTPNAESEYPIALELASGNLARKNILKELDTGIYINNLWYLNFSDRNACKLTGMTRFACFWVEKGEIQAPINVMRFDESLYDLLGDNLQHVTTEREFIFDPSTYGQRSNSSIELPGALVKNMCFTL
ncbi:TldE/PmbA family protein, Beta/Gamma-proteobacterial subgroup [hydrothermal vent metagenome]|uniref:TldE/PmbA family protein, Beta/Gamma-proteobacterial subgroup n=1 Tax=hydrothermal vent metagenome TaxID=652676 RepID=A0A3B0WX60_9ZZZZ